MNAQPLLSIVIPTKNRYETLIPVVKAILNHINSNDFEIVVQDNSDDNSAIQPFLTTNMDERLKYYYQKEWLSQSGNCDLSIERVRGEYVVLIGDDDFVSPYICDIVALLKKQNIECLIYKPGLYYWPNVQFIKQSYMRRPAIMQITKKMSVEKQELNADIELDFVLSKGAMFLYQLPSLYHGLVKISVLQEVKKRFGTYFPGPSPDMACAVALAFTLKKYYFINYPVSITGASKNSAAGLGVRKAHYAELQNLNFLPKDTISKWDPFIPRVWSGPTIITQSASEVVKASHAAKKINYLPLYAHMMIHEFRANAHTIKAMKLFSEKYGNNGIKITILFCRKFFGKIYMWFFVLFRIDKRKTLVVENMNTINDCMTYLKENTPFNL